MCLNWLSYKTHFFFFAEAEADAALGFVKIVVLDDGRHVKILLVRFFKYICLNIMLDSTHAFTHHITHTHTHTHTHTCTSVYTYIHLTYICMHLHTSEWSGVAAGRSSGCALQVLTLLALLLQKYKY
jgi:hypothetical protein